LSLFNLCFEKFIPINLLFLFYPSFSSLIKNLKKIIKKSIFF